MIFFFLVGWSWDEKKVKKIRKKLNSRLTGRTCFSKIWGKYVKSSFWITLKYCIKKLNLCYLQHIWNIFTCDDCSEIYLRKVTPSTSCNKNCKLTLGAASSAEGAGATGQGFPFSTSGGKSGDRIRAQTLWQPLYGTDTVCGEGVALPPPLGMRAGQPQHSHPIAIQCFFLPELQGEDISLHGLSKCEKAPEEKCMAFH